MKNNRKIKFRVWDKEYKEWIGNDDISITNTGEILTYRGETLVGGWTQENNKDNFVIQQFTGLLDINNKEIFEGDIIKVKNNKSKGIGEVIYSFDSFVIVNKCRALFPDNYFSLISGKIIGNILENPELLKNEN